jgi:hypothetical protein
MTRSSTGKTVEERTAHWRERIAEQERSAIPVKQFCKERGITEQSFYVWRKRLRKQEPARFALVETEPTPENCRTIWRINASSVEPNVRPQKVTDSDMPFDDWRISRSRRHAGYRKLHGYRQQFALLVRQSRLSYAQTER